MAYYNNFGQENSDVSCYIQVAPVDENGLNIADNVV